MLDYKKVYNKKRFKKCSVANCGEATSKGWYCYKHREQKIVIKKIK